MKLLDMISREDAMRLVLGWRTEDFEKNFKDCDKFYLIDSNELDIDPIKAKDYGTEDQQRLRSYLHQYGIKDFRLYSEYGQNIILVGTKKSNLIWSE